MKILKFKKLTILSGPQKKAARFQFSDRFNLIVSENKNSVGKSSIVKNIFWSFGCEPRFDSTWKSLDAKTLLEFEVDQKHFWVARHGNRMFLSTDGKKYRVFPKITGNFSEKFASIVNFNARLPEKDENFTAIPPPAFYFCPFYIDQKKSWASTWDSFSNLQQYSGWKREVVPYHTGMVNKKHFEIAEKIFAGRREQVGLNEEIGRIDTAISVVSEFLPPTETTVDLQDFDEIREELKEDLLAMHDKQEELFEMLATLRAEKAHIQNQLVIAQKAVEKTHEDYDYASNLEDDIECPTCGIIHDNSIVNRFSLLEDKDQAEQIATRLQKDFNKTEKAINAKEDELTAVRKKIDLLNKKYHREEKNTVYTLQNILDSTASHAVKNRVVGHRTVKAEALLGLEKNETKLKKQKTNESKDNRKRVAERFRELFPSYTSKLSALGVNSEAIKSPTDYNKVADSGGAAEGSRAMLAYYMAVYNLIYSFGESALSAFVIDTPNQQDQASQHYEKIIKLVHDEVPEVAQVFLCGMDSPSLAPLKENGKTIKLDKEHALLQPDDYTAIQDEIGWIYELTSELEEQRI